MGSTTFGVSKSSRQMQTRTTRREIELEIQADLGETEELNQFFDYEYDYGPVLYDPWYYDDGWDY